jgi:preprotein translocase subunit SecG
MKKGNTPSGSSNPGRRYHKQNRPPAILQAVILVMMIVFIPSTLLLANPSQKGDNAVSTKHNKADHPRKKTFMKRQWGIEILFVRLTSSGYMLEFRYKVLDADKATALFVRQTKPVLTHVKSGAKMIVPTPAKTGALRNSNTPRTGKTYWMFFANPGKFVKAGDLVDIDIGAFRASDLVVH